MVRVWDEEGNCVLLFLATIILSINTQIFVAAIGTPCMVCLWLRRIQARFDDAHGRCDDLTLIGGECALLSYGDVAVVGAERVHHIAQ